MGRKKNRSRGRRGRKKKNSTSKAESSSPNIIIIPEEIIVEILSRLPLDSLPRFTCVSKQWRSLISNISATKTGLPKVLVLSESRSYSFSPQSIDQQQQEEELHVRSIYVPDNMTDSVFGSCNGLLLMNTEEDLFLWNPLTRFFKKVLAFDRLSDDDYRVRSGLCYDSTGDEYKAVLAFAHQTPSYGGEFVVVGSLRSKSWTTIHFPYRVSTVNSGPVVNEHLHWYAHKNDDSGNYFLSPHQIIYFDAHMEKFEEVPMPDPRGEGREIIYGLGALDGCLCMFRSGNNENVELLVMKEYGVQKSWTIMIVVSDCLTPSPYKESLGPLGYTKNGEILARNWTWKESSWYIMAFNPNDNSHRRISIPGGPKFIVMAHEESLITPTDYDWEEEEQKGEATYVVHCYHSRRMTKGKDGYWAAEYIDSE